jgi:hypothetical protein
MDKLCQLIRLMPVDALVKELRTQGISATETGVLDVLDNYVIQQEIATEFIRYLVAQHKSGNINLTAV